MDIKNEILWRIYTVLFFVVLTAMIIFLQTARIQFVEGDKWRARADTLYRKHVDVEAVRGNIMAADGSLLATSVPSFDIFLDTKVADEKLFNDNLDTLSICLASFLDNHFTIGGMRNYLSKGREEGKRYLPILKNASYTEMETIRKFPLFKEGQFKGGLIIKQKSKRRRPFGLLAQRTIGYVRDGIQPVGLEGKFDKELSGEKGKQLMQRITGNMWIPVEKVSAIEPRSGQDIRTTIDINLQDVVEKTLIEAVGRHHADHGCVILMEVSTGAVKAIANIGRTDKGKLYELFNYAIGERYEPGSTYKLAAIMALLEDKYISLEDSVDLEMGTTTFYDEEMKDASYHMLNKTTIRKSFEISSNVGIAKLIHKYYNETKNGVRFINHLKDFQLDKATGINIKGERPPYLKEAYATDNDWSGTTLPWMALGYEVQITPLQLLTFYNAVANNGRMMKPYVVSEISDFDGVSESFGPVELKRRIASKQTIKSAQELLKAVVESGTAKNIRSSHFTMAGKTGTTQLNYSKFKKKDLGYLASFAGYFPADNPKYSCIVVISDPKVGGYYGGHVAAPVFKKIAEKCFATRSDLHIALDDLSKPSMPKSKLPDYEIGFKEELKTILDFTGLPYTDFPKTDWAVVKASNRDTVELYPRGLEISKVPNVVGMGLRDALYLMENAGLKVRIKGEGKVKKQSLSAGTSARGQTIWLDLA